MALANSTNFFAVITASLLGAPCHRSLNSSYYNRGKTRTELGDAKGAIEDYNQALRLNPELAEAYGNRGLLYSQMGDRQAALADLQRAAQLFAKQGDSDSYKQTQVYIQQVQQTSKP